MMAKLLDALQNKNTGRPPIWLMRQAGRYLPEYQKIRKNYSLFEMFHNPEIMIEVTKLPLKLFPLDGAILFADILNVLDGLGVNWRFDDGKGPIVEPTFSPALRDPSVVHFHIREAIIALKEELRLPLIGFAGGPFTVASYIIEGQAQKDLKKTKQLIFSHPEKMNALLETITEATVSYLKIQVAAGVDALQIFDSWAGLLDQESFKRFSLPYLKKILQAFSLPTIVFSRGSSLFAEELADLNPTCISLDWGRPMHVLRKRIPQSIVLQGNLDPSVLLGSRRCIQEAADNILIPMRGEKGFIFNLGHGIFPETPQENVEYLVNYVASQIS